MLSPLIPDIFQHAPAVAPLSFESPPVSDRPSSSPQNHESDPTTGSGWRMNRSFFHQIRALHFGGSLVHALPERSKNRRSHLLFQICLSSPCHLYSFLSVPRPGTYLFPKSPGKSCQKSRKSQFFLHFPCVCPIGRRVLMSAPSMGTRVRDEFSVQFLWSITSPVRSTLLPRTSSDHWSQP